MMKKLLDWRAHRICLSAIDQYGVDLTAWPPHIIGAFHRAQASQYRGVVDEARTAASFLQEGFSQDPPPALPPIVRTQVLTRIAATSNSTTKRAPWFGFAVMRMSTAVLAAFAGGLAAYAAIDRPTPEETFLSYATYQPVIMGSAE